MRDRAGDVEAEVEARILDSAQGNPLFLNEMMNLRDEQGSAAIVAGEVPYGVREVIRQRLDRLPARRARCWIWRRSPATSSICRCWSPPPIATPPGSPPASPRRRGPGWWGRQVGGGASVTRCFARCSIASSPTSPAARCTAGWRRRWSGRRARLHRTRRSPTTRSKVPPTCCRARWTTRCAPPIARRSCWPTTTRSGHCLARATRWPRPATRRPCARACCWRPARPASGAARSRRERPTAGRRPPSRARATTPSWRRGRRSPTAASSPSASSIRSWST